MELYNPIHMISPHWEWRNQLIGNMLMPKKTVIDLGCGARNLLKYYEPAEYLGVDGIPSADLILDLDNDFKLPGHWDYAINSGILEFVIRPDLYLEKIKTIADEYIFSWWRGPGWGRMQFNQLESLISSNYKIIEIREVGLVNKVYRCKSIYSIDQ